MDAAIGEDAVVLERTIDVPRQESAEEARGKRADLIETVRGVGLPIP